MNIKKPNIHETGTYQTFEFECNQNMRIMLVYDTYTKELKYLNIHNDKTNVLRTLGKDYYTFEIALKSYKNKAILNAIKEVEQHYSQNIKVAKTEQNKPIPNILINKVYHC